MWKHQCRHTIICDENIRKVPTLEQASKVNIVAGICDVNGMNYFMVTGSVEEDSWTTTDRDFRKMLWNLVPSLHPVIRLHGSNEDGIPSTVVPLMWRYAGMKSRFRSDDTMSRDMEEPDIERMMRLLRVEQEDAEYVIDGIRNGWKAEDLVHYVDFKKPHWKEEALDAIRVLDELNTNFIRTPYDCKNEMIKF